MLLHFAAHSVFMCGLPKKWCWHCWKQASPILYFMPVSYQPERKTLELWRKRSKMLLFLHYSGDFHYLWGLEVSIKPPSAAGISCKEQKYWETREVNCSFVLTYLYWKAEKITEAFKDQDSSVLLNAFASLDSICFCTKCWQCDPA